MISSFNLWIIKGRIGLLEAVPVVEQPLEARTEGRQYADTENRIGWRCS